MRPIARHGGRSLTADESGRDVYWASGLAWNVMSLMRASVVGRKFLPWTGSFSRASNVSSPSMTLIRDGARVGEKFNYENVINNHV